MPKLLQINMTANWGSTGKIAESIGLAAMNHGWECHVAYGRYSNPSKAQLIRVGSKWDTYFHFLEQRIKDNEGLCSRNATRDLIKQIKEVEPNIVQLHVIHDHYLNYKLLFEYLNQTNIQVVWTFHDCWAFTGHCFHFVTKKCDRWMTECHDCPLRHDYPNTFMDRSTQNFRLKRALFQGCKNLTIVPCSDWIAKFVEKSFLKDKRMCMIHNGVDLRRFRILSDGGTENIKKNRNGGRFRLLGVSSVWNRRKGLDDIYRLRGILPKEQYEIVLVGLTARQARCLPEGIEGITRTQNIEELVKLYNEADVLINPTYADTFPTVNLEALACGTPVITYRTGGSPEALDEKTGMIVEQGDVDALASAIIEMKEHPLAMADCRKRAEAYFDKDKCFEKYIQLYEELLNNA